MTTVEQGIKCDRCGAEIYPWAGQRVEEEWVHENALHCFYVTRARAQTAEHQLGEVKEGLADARETAAAERGRVLALERRVAELKTIVTAANPDGGADFAGYSEAEMAEALGISGLSIRPALEQAMWWRREAYDARDAMRAGYDLSERAEAKCGSLAAELATAQARASEAVAASLASAATIAHIGRLLGVDPSLPVEGFREAVVARVVELKASSG